MAASIIRILTLSYVYNYRECTLALFILALVCSNTFEFLLISKHENNAQKYKNISLQKANHLLYLMASSATVSDAATAVGSTTPPSGQTLIHRNRPVPTHSTTDRVINCNKFCTCSYFLSRNFITNFSSPIPD